MSWIKKRLFITSMIALVAMLIIGGLSFSNIIYLHRITEELVEETTTNTNILQAETAHVEFVLSFYKMFLTKELRTEPLGPHECAFGQWYDQAGFDEEILETYLAMDEFHQTLHEYGHKAWEMASQGDYEGAEKLFVAHVVPAVEQLRSLLNEVSAHANEHVEKSVAESERIATIIIVVTLAVVVLSLILVGFISRQTSESISRPVSELVKGAKTAALGDLTVQLDAKNSKGEIKELVDAFKTMIESLKTIILEIAQGSAEANQASEMLAASSEETSQAAEQIAATIQNIAESGEQLSLGSESLSNHARSLKDAANELQSATRGTLSQAKEAENVASLGQQAVDEAIKQLSVVTETVNFATGAIQKLSKRSEEIGKMVGLIDGIASQTNLLALNAAIEAARAGEAGRGFAVVAEEVRKLAEESALSARKITSLIEDIQSETTVTVNSMEVNADEISQQLKMIKTAGESLGVLVDAVKSTRLSSEKLMELSAFLERSGQELSDLVVDINEKIMSSAAGAQEVAAAAQEQTASQQEVASAAESLRAGINQLLQTTQKFTV
ncbi:MAG: methyl-accepting chemotaxis protein [Zhaonellaceae bacterium]|jgi:methyl-accepting chemotaxis protein